MTHSMDPALASTAQNNSMRALIGERACGAYAEKIDVISRII